MLDFAKDKAGLFANVVVSERWPTRVALRGVECPTLLVHGTGVEYTPPLLTST